MRISILLFFCPKCKKGMKLISIKHTKYKYHINDYYNFHCKKCNNKIYITQRVRICGKNQFIKNVFNAKSIILKILYAIHVKEKVP